ncbi:MAG: heme exporter protein CcmB [Pseudomonadota bacterium]
MFALIARDLRLALRSGGGFGLALGFFLILVVLLPLALGPEQAMLMAIAPGFLWIGALLSALLSLERIFSTDYEDGTLDVLATAPIPFAMVALAKAISHWLTTGLPIALCAPLLGALLGMPEGSYRILVASLLLGTPALSLVGTFGAALTVGLKRGGLLLSVITLPLYMPTLVFGAVAVRRVGQGLDPMTAVWLLTAVSLGCLVLLPLASAAALRVNLR